MQVIPQNGIWLKVKEEAKGRAEEHASELIPQCIAGERTIQQNALVPNMRKVLVAQATDDFNYMTYFEDWLLASDKEIVA